jgi:uncharacterized NAD(P)/FAD-binding protein YdhS
MKIALIGAGPRNLMAFERLVYWALDRNLTTAVEIKIFDAFGIGGRVWNPNQNHELKMNSLASKITLFTDDSIQMKGKPHVGPTLFEWATTLGKEFILTHEFERQNLLLNEIENLTKYSYGSRALFGIYQQWFYAHVQKRMPANFQVELHQENVESVRKEGAQYLLITESAAFQVDAVSAALGESTNEPSTDELQAQKFADEHALKYVPIRYPSEVDVDDIAPSDHVIIRGLGLSFIDYLSELTERRGGSFQRDDHGNLTYTRSGDEPTIYASSRRGLPYHARGLDQKQVGETYPRHFLSDQYVNQLVLKNQKISGDEFLRRIRLDVEFTYYTSLVEVTYPHVDLATFEADLLAHPNGFKKILDKYNIGANYLVDWEQWTNPIPNNVTDTASFTDFLKSYLQQDIDIANEGNKRSPFTSAIEKLRELRSNIRKVVTYKLISDADYVKYVLKQFNPMNNFLAVGPPAFRIEQILALVKSGILTLTGPGMVVENEDDHFMTYSSVLKDQTRYEGNVLIEGRLPQPNAKTTQNPLIKSLLANKMARIYSLQLSDGTLRRTGAIDTTTETGELVSADGNVVPNFYMWGLPTEQRHWLTNGAPIPGVNDVRLRMADMIAGRMITTAQANGI